MIVKGAGGATPKFTIKACDIPDMLIMAPRDVARHERGMRVLDFELDGISHEHTLLLPLTGEVWLSRGTGSSFKLGSRGPVDVWIRAPPASAGFSSDYPVAAWLVPIDDVKPTMVWACISITIDLCATLHSKDEDSSKTITILVPALALNADAALSATDGLVTLTRPSLPQEFITKKQSSKIKDLVDQHNLGTACATCVCWLDCLNLQVASL